MMKNPYGLRNGQLVSVDEVERGLACDCACPACGHSLEAHKGEIVTHYFSHGKGAECGYGLQTAIHVMAKEILAAKKRILLPELVALSDKRLAVANTPLESEVLVKPFIRFHFDEVYLEKRIGRIIPDVVLVKRDRQLLVEITVTHGIDAAKLAFITKQQLSTIEFDFSAADRAITRPQLERLLIGTYGATGLGRSKWIFHPKLASTLEKLNRRYWENYLEPLGVPDPNEPIALPLKLQQSLW